MIIVIGDIKCGDTIQYEGVGGTRLPSRLVSSVGVKQTLLLLMFLPHYYEYTGSGQTLVGESTANLPQVD